MANKLKQRRIAGLLMPILILSQACLAEDSKLGDLEYVYGNEKLLSIAAGHPLPQNLSPSVTSVMTSKDIETIGARRLIDVLGYLPGIHVSSARLGNSVIGFRGIYSETNAQVLILVNGIPLRNTALGGKPSAWTMPVKNISHIEVIRGPGSMLYGGDATTGVINVITKTGQELAGGHIGGFFGSQDTYEGWAQYGQKREDWEVAFSMQGGSTQGSQGRIDRDAQTLLDDSFGTQLSQAPSYTNNGRDDIDTRVDIAYQHWLRFRAGYQRFNQVQTGEGAALALDPHGTTDEDIINLDLSINKAMTNAWILDSKLFFLGQNSHFNLKLLPNGTFGGALPEGVISQASYFQGTTGLTNQLNFTGLKKHNVTLGAGILYNWVTDLSNQINAIISPGLIQQIPLTEVSTLGSDPLLNTKNRTNFYALFQDEWNFANDFYLTTGLRYDYYSDVSGGLSPRAALVWNINNHLTSKLLYSRAFRPPSFLEKNLPSTPEATIQSEIMDTVEFQIENKWSTDLTTSANIYWFELNHLITSNSDLTLTPLASLSPNPVAFVNANQINGIGLETEGRYAFDDRLSFSVNYSYHGVSRSKQTGLLPEHMIKALLNWEFTNDWSLGTQINWIGERLRPEYDPRPPLSDYFIVGITLSTKLVKPVELTLRANNLLGTNAKEPSLNPILLPGDVPVTDRSILGQIKWSF